MQASQARPVRVAAQWRVVCRLYPIYAAIAREFTISDPPYASVESIEDTSSPEVLERLHGWLSDMDERVRAHHFRHVLQNTDLATTEQMLHTLVQRYLDKPKKSDSDRDKLDFLLAHYFAVCAPPSYRDRALEVEDVAEVLEGVLGECSTAVPSWLGELEELVQAAEGFHSLRALVDSRVIERGRALKVSAGAMYFGTSAMVAFTRFNFVVRRNYVRLFEADLVSLEESLGQLADHGIHNIDCRSIGMEVDSVERLQQHVAGLRGPRVTDYRNDSVLLNMMELRRLVEATLAHASTSRNAGRRLLALERQFEIFVGEIARLNAEIERLNAVVDDMQGSAALPAPADLRPGNTTH